MLCILNFKALSYSSPHNNDILVSDYGPTLDGCVLRILRDVIRWFLGGSSIFIRHSRTLKDERNNPIRLELSEPLSLIGMTYK